MIEAKPPRDLFQRLVEFLVRLDIDQFGCEFLREISLHSPARPIGRALSNTPPSDRLLVASPGASIAPVPAAAVAPPKVGFLAASVARCRSRHKERHNDFSEFGMTLQGRRPDIRLACDW